MIRSPKSSFPLLLGLVLLPGCAPAGFKIMPVPVDRSLKEVELQRDAGSPSSKIALIDVTGVIMNSAKPGLLSSGEHPVSLLVEKLDAARKDKRVKAAILRINSPGGTITASEIMHSEILRFRASGKPVVAIMMDVAASGGYYIACACDQIIAYPSTVTGSIGVIMQTVNLAGAMNKIGVSSEAIKSGPMKDAGSPFRTMDPAERAIFQGVIDEMYQRFVQIVDDGRKSLDRENVLKLADGRIYTAGQALEAGLIDHIGSVRDAVELTKQLAGISTCRVVTYQRPMTWHPNIYAQVYDEVPAPQATSLLNLDWPSWLRPGEVNFMYLWTPN